MTVTFILGAGMPPDLQNLQGYPLLFRLLVLCPETRAPAMPDALDPTPEGWLRGVDAALSPLGPDDVVIAHSLGGSMVLRWLAERPAPFRLGALLALATPWWGPSGWDHPAFGPPAGFGPTTDGIGRIALCQCRDDDVVGVDHLEIYARALPRARTTLLETGGHMLDTDAVEPVLRAALSG